jgi:AraC family transcriptional regulator of adaptative response / DNA-3-methyladenine glycosylase II
VRETVGVIEVRPVLTGRHVLLLVPAQFSKHLLTITDRVRDLLDLRSDPQTISEHLSSDAWLSTLVHSNPGLRVPGAWDGFEIAVRAILGQQVSVKAASTMAGRLVQAFGERLPQSDEAGLTSLFPSPDRLSDADLTEVGLTRQRARSIQALARAVKDGELSFKTSASLDGAIERLTALPGIGAWTAHYIAMRALREPDAFPAGDLGLRRAISADGLSTWSEKELIERSESWRPWRAYAAMHLWNRYGALRTK